MGGRTCCSEPGYSLRSNRKTREGSNHADRDAQFGLGPVLI